MRRLVVVAAAVALAFSPATPRGAGAQEACDDPRFAPALDTLRTVMAEEALPSVAIAVAEGGQVTCEAAFGWADAARRIPATSGSLYSLASISKPFTATLLMTLVEQGVIDLDRPANDYLARGRLTGFAGDAAGATVRRLLTHTAGLPLHYQFFYEGGPEAPSMDEAIDRWANVVYPPGGRYFYANLGYGVLERIVEVQTGMSYADALRERVLEPLGLGATTVSDGSDLDGTVAALRSGADWEPVPPYTFDHVGASGVWSSARELIRFGLFHLGNDLPGADEVLTRETRALMRRSDAPADRPGQARGLGWGIDESEHRGWRRVSHTGSMPGVTTRLSLYPDADVALVVLQNTYNGGARERIARALADAALPEPPPGADAERPEARPADPTPPSSRPADPSAPSPRPARWRGWTYLPSETVPVELTIRDDGDVHVRFGDQMPMLLAGARFSDPPPSDVGEPAAEWLEGSAPARLSPPDATPPERAAEHFVSLTLARRDGVLEGWASAISSATPRTGAVSFPVRLRPAEDEDSPPDPGLRRNGGPTAASIRVEDLHRRLAVLAADSLGGRGAGYPGGAKAADFIAREMEAMGLAPGGGDGGWIRPFTLHPRRPPEPFQTLESRNVVGVLEGSDPALRDEIVVVGAHFDGQGRTGEADMSRRDGPEDRPGGDEIWNSANDNGAAVAAMLELAEWAAGLERRPARTLVFVAFGAEEHGLVGSLQYVAHPPLPWERHVAMVNLEMLGWAPDQTLNARATATSPDWPELLRQASRRSGVPIRMRQAELTNDTDHYGFSAAGVPSIHYGVPGSRLHYHATTDELDGIAFDALADRTRHTAALLDELANRAEPPRYGWNHPPDPGITGIGLTDAEAERVGLAEETSAFKVTAVARALAAERAGLRAGDVVTAVDGEPIPDGRSALGSAVRAFRRLAPGEVMGLTVWRQGEVVLVTLEADAGTGRR